MYHGLDLAVADVSRGTVGACPWAKYHLGIGKFALYGPAMIPVGMTASRLDQHLLASGAIYAPEDDSVYLLTRHTQVGELLDETAPWPNWIGARPMEIEHEWRIEFTILVTVKRSLGLERID